MTRETLLQEFRAMLGWRYEWGAAREGCVDCSGAFVYAMNRHGLSIYHGSNTIWRAYLTEKGAIDGEPPLGAAVFKNRASGREPEKYRGDGIGDMYHIGLYAGDGAGPLAQYDELYTHLLPESDVLALQQGVPVYSETELQKRLEDYGL